MAPPTSLSLPPADPSGWYVAVARYSQAAQSDVAQVFAGEVYATIRSGAQRTTQDGQAIVLPPDPRIIPDRAAARLQLAPIIVPPPDFVHDPARLSAPECPADLPCTDSPNGYWQYGSHKNDYGDHDIADRPKNLPIRYITLHDNELTGDTTLWLFHDPTYLASAHYEGRLFCSPRTAKPVGWHWRSIRRYAWRGCRHCCHADKTLRRRIWRRPAAKPGAELPELPPASRRHQPAHHTCRSAYVNTPSRSVTEQS
jgi:hypothetical protein